MVDLYQLTGQAWSFISGGSGSSSRMNCLIKVNSGSPPSQRVLDFLQGQFLGWHRSIPRSLKFQHPNGQTMSGEFGIEQPRRLQSLRTQLYLRCNEMRILLYRPLLFSSNSLHPHLATGKVVVSTATDSIRVLWHLHKTSGLYEKLQVCFNHFLESSVAVLFLALAHAPSHFTSAYKEGIGQAKEIIGSFADQSPLSKRLYQRVIHLEGLANGLQLRQGDSDFHQPSFHRQFHISAGVFDATTLSHRPQLYDNDPDSRKEAVREPPWLPLHVGDGIQGRFVSNLDSSWQTPYSVEDVNSFEPQWEDGAFDGLFTNPGVI